MGRNAQCLRELFIVSFKITKVRVQLFCENTAWQVASGPMDMYPDPGSGVDKQAWVTPRHTHFIINNVQIWKLLISSFVGRRFSSISLKIFKFCRSFFIWRDTLSSVSFQGSPH